MVNVWGGERLGGERLTIGPTTQCNIMSEKINLKYLETIVESIFNDCYGNDYRLQTKSDCPAQKANMNSKLLLG